MLEVPPAEPLSSLLNRLHADVGVVVDYILLRPEAGPQSLEDVHRAAALAGMRIQDEREAVWQRAAASRMGISPEQIPRMVIGADRATAAPELLARFLEDYWYAFSSPPYPIRCVGESAEGLFRQVNELLFGNLSDWSIRRWSTDWSDYFTYGLDWWGAFLWTLVRQDGELVVWVGASTTD
jgi:hypothetical protein